MSCVKFSGAGFVGYICGIPDTFRLPLSSGGRIYMEWHSYFGPTFFFDRKCSRIVEAWWMNEEICDALDWFQKRGKKA